MGRAGINSHAWQKLRQRALEAAGPLPPCGVCGHPVDTTLSGRDPWGPSVDHIIPRAFGAPVLCDLSELRVVHMRCNSKRGRGAPPTRRGPARQVSPVMRDQLPLGTVEADGPGFFGSPSNRLLPSGFINSNPAANTGNSENVAAPVLDDQYLDESTYRPPRLETPTPANAAGTLGDEMIAWLDAEMGVTLRPWQSQVARRALELDEHGQLRWPTVLLTVPRQCGKSVLARAIMMWRLVCGQQFFGEPQTVISTAQDLKIARHIWKVAADTLLRRAGDQLRVMRGAGQERIEIGEMGNEWLLVAPTATCANGLSVSMAMIDEAFAVPRDVVTSSIRPTMLARKSPQLFMLSTAGETSSRLLQDYREQALVQMEDPEKAKILLMEWSAMPGRPIDDRDGWVEASPMWDGDRAAFIEEEMRTSRTPQVFMQQYLNQWVANSSAWVSSVAWEACTSSDDIPSRDINPGTIAVETSTDSGHVGAVLAVLGDDGRVHVDAHVEESLPDMRAWLGRFCEGRRGVTVIHHETVRLGQLRGATLVKVKRSDSYAGFQPAKEAIEDQALVHPGDPQLTEQVLSAGTWRSGQDGYTMLSQHNSPISIYLARAMIWAVGRELDPSRKRRPLIATA